MYETLEHEDFLEMEHEDFLEMETEDEDFLEMEDEQFFEMEDEDFLEMEDEQFFEHEDEQFFEHEDEQFLEMEDEQFLGAIGSVLSNVLGGELESGPLHEFEERELAAELLEVQSEDELEQFIGKLVKRAARGVSNFARSSTGRALGGMLKSVAKKALPMVGGALGSMVAPGVGTAIGSKLGSLAGGLFEMEDEVVQGELEFELARRVTSIGALAANRAAHSRVALPPAAAARRAIVSATRTIAPAALPRSLQSGIRPGRPGSSSRIRPADRWVGGGSRRPVGARRPAVAPRYRGRRPVYRAAGGPRSQQRPVPYGRNGYRSPTYGRGPRSRVPQYRGTAGRGVAGARRGYGRWAPGGTSAGWAPSRNRRIGSGLGYGHPGGPGGWAGEPSGTGGSWVRTRDGILVLGV
jgi:uncharacterized protein (DUF697 family)